MEKRIFNQIIKKQMLSFGFEKTSTYDYAKEAEDGIAKIIVRVPDQTFGFCMGAQFKDFKTDYADYSGKYSNTCMVYPKFTTFLHFAYKRDYTEDEIIEAVQNVMDGLENFLQRGREAIRESIDEWVFGVQNEKKQNDIYAYFGMPLIDPYSDSYILKQVEEYKRGMKSMMALDEYNNHKEHYDKYVKLGCNIDIGKDFVTISYDSCQIKEK